MEVKQRWTRSVVLVLGWLTAKNLCNFGDRLGDFLLLTKVLAR